MSTTLYYKPNFKKDDTLNAFIDDNGELNYISLNAAITLRKAGAKHVIISCLPDEDKISDHMVRFNRNLSRGELAREIDAYFDNELLNDTMLEIADRLPKLLYMNIITF